MLVLGVVTLNNLLEMAQGTESSNFRFISFVATLGIVLALYFFEVSLLGKA